MKKFLCTVLMLCIVFNFVLSIPMPVFAATSGTCGTNLTWTLDDEGTLTISGTGDMTNWASSSSVPWSSYQSSIKSVVIDSGVTSIGNDAFRDCGSIISVTIPDSVTSIGESAFYNCSSLASVTLGNSVTSIGNHAFRDCGSLTSVTIGNSVKSIGIYAFSGCSSLTSVEIPDSVTSIGDGTFNKCSSLTSVTIGNSVTSIGGYSAFQGCSSLTSITLPDSVTSIGVNAFRDCGSLTSVTLGNSVTSIENCAFYGCGRLTSITLPDSITSIGGSAFYYCSSLTSVEIPDSVKSIGGYAFLKCSSLTAVYISDLAAWCNISFFDNCYSNPLQYAKKLYLNDELLTDIVIPDSVTSLGNYTFFGCSSLTSITIPNSVTSIGMYAFYGCGRLTSITVSEENPNYASVDGVLFDKDKTTLIQYPIGNNRIVYNIPDGVTSIGTYAFNDCDSITRVEIPDSVTSIRGNAFSDCSSLMSVTIGNSVTSIGVEAFSDCSSLTSVTIPNSVTSIIGGAFGYCSNLKNVYYGGSEAEWVNITIGPVNECLINATIHFNYIDKSNGTNAGTTESINLAGTNKIQVIVYENRNDSSTVNDDYRLSVGATVSCNYGDVKTNSNGSVVIATDGRAVTVSKDGYLTQTIESVLPEKKYKIYLQQIGDGRPVLNAVWIGETNTLVETYSIDITGTETTTLNAEVVWGSGGEGRLYLMQEGRRVEFSGSTLTTVLSNKFDVSEAIYIVAENAEGKATKKKLKIDADGNINNALNDYKLSFGDSVTGIIPNNIPVIGGNKVGLDIPMIPITVTFEDNKFYAVIGLDVKKASREYSFIKNVNGDSTSIFKKETKYLCENIKEGFKNSADKYSFSKLKTKWMKAKYNYTAHIGFESDLTVIGYLEGYVDSNGKVSILDGGVGINPSIGVSAGSQILLVPPLYWEAELKGEIEAMLNVYLNETAKNFTPNGTVSGDVTLKGGVGLGASGVVGVSGGVEGNIGVDWDIYVNEQDYVNVNGSIGAYVKAFAGPITIIDKSFKFAEGTIWDYPSTRVNMMSLMEVDIYDTAEYSFIDRSYTKNESKFVANDEKAELFSYNPQNKVETVFKTNVYPYSEPQLVQFGDGTMLAAWLDDDTDRSAVNRTTVMYSYYDGSAWSEPVQLQNDGTGDFAPDLKVINGNAYITWINADKVLSDDADTTEIFTAWEIAAAEFDKENAVFINAVNVTDNDSIDMMPVIYGGETGVEIAWTQNTSGDIFGTENTYSIMTSSRLENSDVESNPEFEEGSAAERIWSLPDTYASKLMPVANIDGCIYNGESYIAYVLDLDGDQNDFTDKEVFLNNVQLTSNDVPDTNTVFADGRLYYYSGGTVVQYDIATATQDTVIDYISSDRFKVLSSGKKIAVVYGEADALVNELYAAIYDAGNDAWGEKVALTQLDSSIESFDGIMKASGVMKFIVNKTEITGDVNSIDPYGQTDIVLIEVTPTYNLSIDSVWYHEELLMGGNTQEFYCTITNKGELVVNDYKVQVMDAGGKVLATTYNEEAILPGETVEFTAYYPLGDEFTPHDVVIKVEPINVEDFDESDNLYELSLNLENISLENLGYGVDSDGNAVIYVDVVNRGYSEVEAVTATLRKGSYDGEIVDTMTITEQLGTLDLAAISFTVPFEDGAVYCVELDCEGKNRDFVVMKTEEAIQEDMVSVTIDETITIYDSLNEAISAVNEGGKTAEIKLLGNLAEEKISYDCNFAIDLGGFTVETLEVIGNVNLVNGSIDKLNVLGIVATENVTVTNTNAATYGTEGTKGVYTSFDKGVSMIEGAQVRIGGGVAEDGTIDANSGLRFISQVNNTDTLAADIISKHYANSKYEDGYSMGTMITAEESDAIVYIPATTWQDKDYTVYTAAIKNLKASNFNRKFTVQAYVEYNGVKLINEESTTRSIYAVAAGLLAQSGEEDAEKLVKVLNAYVNQTGIRLILADNALAANAADSGKKGAYSGDAFFSVGETKVDGKTYTVVLTPVGERTTLDTVNFAKYIRINNNNSQVKAAVELTQNSDGTYTLVFDLEKVN